LLSIVIKTTEKGKKIIQIDDELVECLRKGLGKYLVTNQSGELYKSSSALQKSLKKSSMIIHRMIYEKQ
jgi:hypothetical protein